MKTFVLVVVIILTTTCVIRAQDSWFIKLKQMPWLSQIGKIKLLESTRQEVEKVLGTPDNSGGADFIGIYDTENGRVFITYTTEQCSSIDGKIKKNVIEDIDFKLDADIKFATLRIPVQKFKKSVESDVPSLFIYENKRNGITITRSFGRVNSIKFVPPESKKFSCPNE